MISSIIVSVSVFLDGVRSDNRQRVSYYEEGENHMEKEQRPPFTDEQIRWLENFLFERDEQKASDFIANSRAIRKEFMELKRARAKSGSRAGHTS